MSKKCKRLSDLPRTGIEPVILSLLVTRFTTEPTGLDTAYCGAVEPLPVIALYEVRKFTRIKPSWANWLDEVGGRQGVL